MLNECVLLVFGEGEIDLISSVEAGRRNISAGLDLPVLCFFFFFDHEARGILSSQPGIKPEPSALKAKS